MRLFSCPNCGLVVFFGNVRCERCATALGYEPIRNVVLAMPVDGAAWKYCANSVHAVCTWLLPIDSPDTLCRACRHNLLIPDLSAPANVELWRKMEEAKHRLLYTVLRLDLPLSDRTEKADGLGFEFPADVSTAPVKTGHANGLITIALAEADDAERERRRAKLHEPYRTLLGHFRHEVGHWFWDELVRDSTWRGPFTALFGDASQDYGQALAAHYANGPRADWQETFISAYASSHPWEDFAETWAHYFHMIDTLETGRSFGIALSPRLDRDEVLTTSLDFNVYASDVEVPRLLDAWIALCFALNSFNRSMGLPDSYPFVLSPKVMEKLGFVHALVQSIR